jgi:hypothetical protein
MQQKSRVVVLVKALPQPSKTYGETVCCAGVTVDGKWKRLFPVRFRHLMDKNSFSRWDWVRYGYRLPTHDNRPESCHVCEDTIAVDGKLAPAERTRLLTPLIKGSAVEAMGLGSGTPGASCSEALQDAPGVPDYGPRAALHPGYALPPIQPDHAP